MSLPGSRILLTSRYKIFSVNVHEFKIRNDLCIICKDTESVNMEFLHEKRRNTWLTVVCRPSNSKIEPFENFFNNNKNSFPDKKFQQQFKSNFILGLYDICFISNELYKFLILKRTNNLTNILTPFTIFNF